MKFTYDDFLALWSVRRELRHRRRAHSRFDYGVMEWHGAICYVVYHTRKVEARYNIRFGGHSICVRVGRDSAEIIRASSEALVEARLRGLL